ncbi:alpha/beta hydrolase [Candidatus Peregrinibacteria bacterium]|nr:alpha/beta hydrolase [Candidatus Peregrinibacteria bacterium]
MKSVLLCLHGWGGSKESFAELRDALRGADLEILAPDLPGFGSEQQPPRAWTTDDYADWVICWLKGQLIGESANRRVLLLGHSHGGRIAIKLAARLHDSSNVRPTVPITRLFLCASAGIRRPRHIKRIIGLLLAKIGKLILSVPGLQLLRSPGKKLLYKLVRVHDYEKASPVMRETLIKVSAEDLTPLLPRVTVPTDIFWGEDDGMTPVADGLLIHSLIRGSALHVFRGVRHRVHREKAVEIAAKIREALCDIHPS